LNQTMELDLFISKVQKLHNRASRLGKFSDQDPYLSTFRNILELLNGLEKPLRLSSLITRVWRKSFLEFSKQFRFVNREPSPTVTINKRNQQRYKCSTTD